MYQSPYNPNYIIPDLHKYQCLKCNKEFILSTAYDNSHAKCPYCGSLHIEHFVTMDDPDKLSELGCIAISILKD